MMGPESTTVPSKSKSTTGKRTSSIVARRLAVLETQRVAQLVEQRSAQRRRLDERCDLAGLLLGQRDRGLGGLARPDAEPHLRLRGLVAEVARDPQRLGRVAAHPGVWRKELDELASLGHGAPGAVAEPVLGPVPALATRVH